MKWFEDFLEERRWLYMMKRARRLRREMLFSERVAFDAALRPRLHDGAVIAYPDAIYYVNPNDFCRALDASEQSDDRKTT